MAIITLTTHNDKRAAWLDKIFIEKTIDHKNDFKSVRHQHLHHHPVFLENAMHVVSPSHPCLALE